jgi:hypothetical protein
MKMEDRPQDEILKLRKRVQDLLGLGYVTPESAGTYEQTLLQVWQEADRRRQALKNEAESYRARAMQAEAQAGAFSAIASILYNIVNGFFEAGQKRVREEAERAAREAEEKAERAQEIVQEQPTVEATAPKRGRKKSSG